MPAARGPPRGGTGGCHPPFPRPPALSVTLHLSNGVCGIFLLSPLCCRKREVWEPQAPAPVLQVTQPFPLPKIPPPASRRGRSPGRVPPCGASFAGATPRLRLPVGLAVRRGDPARAAGQVTRRVPHTAERGWSVAGGLLGGSHRGGAGLHSARGEHPAPMLRREEPAGFSQGRLQEPGQPLCCSFHYEKCH